MGNWGEITIIITGVMGPETCNWSLGATFTQSPTIFAPSLIGENPATTAAPTFSTRWKPWTPFFFWVGGEGYLLFSRVSLFFLGRGGLTAIFGGAKGHLWKIHFPLVGFLLRFEWSDDVNTRLESLPNQTFNVWYIYLAIYIWVVLGGKWR